MFPQVTKFTLRLDLQMNYRRVWLKISRNCWYDDPDTWALVWKQRRNGQAAPPRVVTNRSRSIVILGGKLQQVWSIMRLQTWDSAVCREPVCRDVEKRDQATEQTVPSVGHTSIGLQISTMFSCADSEIHAAHTFLFTLFSAGNEEDLRKSLPA